MSIHFISWYHVAAKSDNVRAIYRLGLCYEFGDLNCIQSDLEAIKHYNIAAKHDYAQAQYRVGRFLELGRGVEQSYELAAQCYDQAANGYYTEAFYRLGSLHLQNKPWINQDPAMGVGKVSNITQSK